jgi:hypothetical protein
MVRGRRAWWGLRVSVPDLATLAIVIAGASVMVGWGGGLYWLVGGVLVYVVWSCVNAWQSLASGPAAG